MRSSPPSCSNQPQQSSRVPSTSKLLLAVAFFILVVTPIYTNPSTATQPRLRNTSITPNRSPSGNLSSSRVQTPPYLRQYFQGIFYITPVGGVKTPSNGTTVKVGTLTQIDFIATPQTTIQKASINMSIPRLTLNATGTTSFSGEIPSGSSVDLRVFVKPIMETQEIINVHAAGDIVQNTGGYYHTDEYYDFLMNTTGWYNVTHTNPPYDPYGSNATVLPTVNITSPTGMSLAIPSSSPLPVSSSTDPITVSGILYYQPLNGPFTASCVLTGNGCAVRGARVEVWDEDSCVADHRMGTVYTSNLGAFSISFSRSFGFLGGCTVNNFHVSVFAQNDATAKSAPSCPASNCDWGWWEVIMGKIGSNYGTPLVDNEIINLGAKGVAGDDPAFEVYDGLLIAATTIANHGFTVTWQQVGVYETSGNYTPHTNILPSIPDGVIFFPNPSCNGCFGWGYSTVFHEWGHAMMERIYGGAINWPCGLGCVKASPHNPGSVTGPGFAISEGWAEFISQLIYGSVSAGDGCCGVDVENGGYLCAGCNGDMIEGEVASVFWDLVDGGPDEAHNGNGVFTYLIGANKDDVTSEFHTDHRNDMLAVFTDILNANEEPIQPLCRSYVEFGISPQQCAGVNLPMFPEESLTIGLTLILLGPAIYSFRKKNPHRSERPLEATSLGKTKL